MTRVRSSHVQKTLQDRQRYYDTTITPSATPTLDERHFGDDPNSTEVPEEERTGLLPRQYRAPDSGLMRYLKQHGLEILIGVILVPLLVWMAYQLYTLNREIGELRAEVAATSAAEQRTRQDVDRVEERLQKEFERLSNRVTQNSQIPASTKKPTN